MLPALPVWGSVMRLPPVPCHWDPLLGPAWETEARAFLADQARRVGGVQVPEPGAPRAELLAALERLRASAPLTARNQALCDDFADALAALGSLAHAEALEHACRTYGFHPFVLRGIDPLFSQTVANFPWASMVGKWASGHKAQETHPCRADEQPLLVEVSNPQVPSGLTPLLVVVPLGEAAGVLPRALLSLRPWGGSTPLALGGKVTVAGQVWPLAPEDWALWATGAERSGELYEGCLWPRESISAGVRTTG